MAWVTPTTFTSGNVLTAAQLNILSGDLNETAAAKATAASQIVVSTAANNIVMRQPTDNIVNAAETTTSTSFTTLTTAGPTVSVATGLAAIIFLTAKMFNNTANANNYLSYDLSGASTQAPADSRGLANNSAIANSWIQTSYCIIHGGLTAGTNTFSARYRVNTGTGTFDFRRLTVLPL